MKKILKTTALFLALVLCLSMTVLAEDYVSNGLAKLYAQNGAVVGFDTEDTEKVTVHYENSAIVEGAGYIVMVLEDDGSEVISPTETNIIYVDQVTGGAGSVDFSVFVSRTAGSAEECVIMFYLPDEAVCLAKVESETILGDVDGDKGVNSSDLIRLAQYLVGANTISSARAADTNADGEVNSSDLIRLAQYLVGSNTLG